MRSALADGWERGVNVPYLHYNPNPFGLSTEDCAVRTLCAILRIDWESAHKLLSDTSRDMGLMPSNPAVIWAILKMRGFHRSALWDQCPDCYTVAHFAEDHPRGVFVVATATHILAVIGGNWYDSWNSGDEIPLFYWQKINK